MNKINVRLFDVFGCIGRGLEHNLLALGLIRSIIITKPMTMPTKCYSNKPLTHLVPYTPLYPCSTCREAGHRSNYSCKIGIRFASSYPSDDPDENFVVGISDYRAFKRREEHGKQGLMKKLQDILKCSQNNISCIINEYPELLLFSSETLTNRIQNLRKFGIKRDTLKDNPWLLLYKPQEIARKFVMLDKMKLDINIAAPLLQISSYQLKEISYKATKEAALIPVQNRIMHISNILECHPSEVCKAAAKHTFLLTIPYERISTILDLLLEFNIPGNEVLNDVWIFRYSPLTIEKRFNEMRNAGIQLKPWVVRCSEQVFTNALRRRVESRNTLGKNSSLLEYLSQRLECSIENILVLGQRYPPILKVHVTKIKEVLDFLFNEGFSPQQVYQVPRILCHSLETTQERLKQLRDLQHNPTSLMILCKSKRQFVEYVNRLSVQQKHSFTGYN